MADQHGHDSDDPHANHDDAPEQDAVRTPAWLTFVGLGLLVFGALGSYLWIYPGTMNPHVETAGDAATGDASAEGGAAQPTPAGQQAPAPAQPGQPGNE
jgi:hypothetical protein